MIEELRLRVGCIDTLGYRRAQSICLCSFVDLACIMRDKNHTIEDLTLYYCIDLMFAKAST